MATRWQCHRPIDPVSRQYISQIEAGTMRALAVTSAQRRPTLPNVPTMAEAGVPNFVVTSWAAYVMPNATPPRDR